MLAARLQFRFSWGIFSCTLNVHYAIQWSFDVRFYYVFVWVEFIMCVFQLCWWFVPRNSSDRSRNRLPVIFSFRMRLTLFRCVYVLYKLKSQLVLCRCFFCSCQYIERFATPSAHTHNAHVYETCFVRYYTLFSFSNKFFSVDFNCCLCWSRTKLVFII